jgi:hypothetical protein
MKVIVYIVSIGIGQVNTASVKAEKDKMKWNKKFNIIEENIIITYINQGRWYLLLFIRI